MTARQENILEIALEKGYFEFPKKITLRELARALDIVQNESGDRKHRCPLVNSEGKKKYRR